MSFFFPVRRKSNIVKEMEKMKNKREEKRAQNSEIRTKRAQVGNDTAYKTELAEKHAGLAYAYWASWISSMGFSGYFALFKGLFSWIESLSGSQVVDFWMWGEGVLIP